MGGIDGGSGLESCVGIGAPDLACGKEAKRIPVKSASRTAKR